MVPNHRIHLDVLRTRVIRDVMHKRMDEEMKDPYGGSRWSKFFAYLSWGSLFCLFFGLIWLAEACWRGGRLVSPEGTWERLLLCAIVFITTLCLSHHLAKRAKAQGLDS